MSNEMKTEEDVVEFDQDIFDAMVYGNFEEDAVDPNAEDTGVEDYDEYQEDTDQEDESELEEELDEESDGDLDDVSEDPDEDEEEDSLVEDYDSDDEDDDIEDEDEDADEADESEEDDIDEESEDDTDTEDTSDGEGSDTDEIDYKAFYDAVVNTEFVVNGRKTKGFSDPQKIIQSQQMAGGFSEKMAGFKQYRPFMSPLKERGMLDDQAKFDLAMNLIDGDKEAIKAHLQSLNIDPLDLDMEKIDYSGKSNVASQESLVIEDVMERARASGIEDKVRQVVGNEWDAESFREFTTNDAVRNDLLSHIETGVYDDVQDKIAEMSRLDYNGSFGSLKTIEKYRAAVRELQASAPAPVAPAQSPANPAPARSAAKPSVKAEKAKIEKARKEEAYKAKATEREAKLTQQRKRAASVSRKKAKPKAKAVFDPMKVEGSELDELMNILASGGRG
jgi:hypothetical protein